MERRALSKSIRRIVVAITVCSVAFHGSGSVSAASTADSYRQQNDILYYSEGCSTAGANGAASAGAVIAGGGGGGGCGGTAEENKQQIWSFLKSKGLTDEAAAGIMGNMQQESGFMPTADNGKTMGFQDSTGRGCRGVVQWCHERNSGLDSFAAGKGTSWDCLGTQLEYMWYEMTETEQGQYNGAGDRLDIPLADALNGKPFANSSNYTGSGAYNAGAIFHDYFERANTAKGEHLGRGDNAETIYKEFTGKEADTSLLGNASSKAGNACAVNTQTGDGVIPSEECQELVREFDTLKASGKIKTGGAKIDKDLQKCTTDQISCGFDSDSGGGVDPKTLRAIVAAAKNSGAATMEIWNINSDHFCDEYNHPRGQAADIACDGNDPNTGTGASEDCNKMFKYFYDNHEELGLTELIWEYPPKEYSCDDPIVMCSGAGDHSDHIHIGTKVERP